MIRLEFKEIRDKYTSILNRVQVFQLWGKKIDNPTFILSIYEKIDYLNSFACKDERFLYEKLDELDSSLNQRFMSYNSNNRENILYLLKYISPLGFESCFNEYEERNIEIPRICQHCHTPMETKRTDSKYCTIGCKQAAYRVRKQIQHP